MEYVLVAGIGALVGAGELASRYSEHPSGLLRVAGAWFYVGVNAGAAVAALALVQAFEWDFGAPNASAATALQILIAGFGSVALFRSSLFTFRVGDQDVAVGPSLLVATLLGVADKSIDRGRARHRSRIVTKIMAGVSFEKARVALPVHCFALLRDVPEEVQSEMASIINVVADNDGMTDAQKSYLLGLFLIRYTGPLVVERAVRSLGAEIRTATG